MIYKEKQFLTLQCDWICEYRFISTINECQRDNIEINLKEVSRVWYHTAQNWYFFLFHDIFTVSKITSNKALVIYFMSGTTMNQDYFYEICGSYNREDVSVGLLSCKMETVCFPETLVSIYKSTQHYNLDDQHQQNYFCIVRLLLKTSHKEKWGTTQVKFLILMLAPLLWTAESHWSLYGWTDLKCSIFRKSPILYCVQTSSVPHSGIQWPAVSTQKGLIMAPPQMCWLRMIKMICCQEIWYGKSPAGPPRYFSNQLFPWSRTAHKKLIVAWLVKKYPTFCGTHTFITMFIQAHHWSVS
jgi:hypothetical protein